MIQVFKIINCIDDINCEKFFEFADYDVLEVHISNDVFNMFGHKIIFFSLSSRSAHVWNTKLSQLTICCTNDKKH